MSAAPGRTVGCGEQIEIDRYNDLRRAQDEAQRKAIDDGLKDLFPITWPPDIDGIKDDFGGAARTTSPIVLDLDGNGIQTTRLSQKSGTHFNLDAKGLAENTGWAGKDDGLLVRDLDGDGKITSGRELFGNHTLLSKGPNAGKEAANGFDALADLDDNADGVVDSKDTAFNSLRVWKDTNGDGVTDSGELLTLDEASIKSLNVTYTDNSGAADAQGNTHKQLGGYTRTDGSTRQMDDVWFAVDEARTVNRELVSVSDSIKALPDLAAMGNMRSLHQAMAKDTSGKLQGLVAQYADPAATFVQRDALMQDILFHWAGVQDVDPASRAAKHIYGNAIGDARKLEFLEELLGREYVGVWCWGESDPNPHGPAAAKLLSLYERVKKQISSSLELQSVFDEDIDSLKIVWSDSDKIFQWDASKTVSIFREKYTVDPAATLTHLERLGKALAANDSVRHTIVEAIQALGNTTGDELDRALLQVGGGQIVFTGGTDGDNLTGNDGDNYFYGLAGQDTLTGGAGNDTYYFNAGEGQDVVLDLGSDARDVIRFGIGITPEQVHVERGAGAQCDDLIITLGHGDRLTVQYYFYSADYRVEDIAFADGTAWNVGEVVAKISQQGTETDDRLFGMNDYSNRVYGLGGSDVLKGGALADTLDGGDGQDSLLGGAGDDILTGGAGDDTLEGGVGNDAYIFNNADGKDVIFENDDGTGNIDTLKLGAGLTAANTLVARSGNDLTFNWSGNTVDQVTVEGFFLDDAYRIEEVSFAEGTVWTLAQLAARLIQNGSASADNWTGLADQANRMNGLGGDDTLFGGGLVDAINGGDGNDQIWGLAGDDVLVGAAGNDMVYGAEGNDSLGGGTGNDTIHGGAGNDIYVFNKSDGKDTMADVEYGVVSTDTLKLGTGLTAASTLVGRSGNDLTFNWSGNTVDQVTVEGFFLDNAYRIEKVSFAEGTVWTLAQLAARLTQNGSASADSWYGIADQPNRMNGLAGDDTLSGGEQVDVLTGGAGQDSLIAGGGGDVLSGGAGQDVLWGGGGADRFVFDSPNGSDNADMLMDFSAEDGDQLVFDDANFSKLSGLSDLTGKLRLVTQAPEGGDDFIVYNPTNGQVLYDASGGADGSAGMVLIATLNPAPWTLEPQRLAVI